MFPLTNNFLQTCFPCFLRARVSRQQHLLIWGGGDWLEPVNGALEFDIFGPGMGSDGMGWDGMGWSGSCGRGSGAGSLEFGDSRLMVIWRAAVTWGRWRRYCSCQTSATIFAGRSGRCRAVWRQVLAAAGISGGN